ncbi:MAG: 30S ribosomal protein S2 [Candidatus Moranbacteria bacterium]|nr:30S ribosomal protein S2 [Candidatus Moranbacteria bacterium]
MEAKKIKQSSDAPSVSKTEPKSASEDYFADFDFGKLELNLETMLKSGLHFGHQKSRKNPQMEPYIFTTKKGISIIDLEKSLEKLEEALAFLKKVKSDGKQILFVGTKEQARGFVRSAARRCQMPHVAERWLGGTFTNFKVIRSRAKYLKDSQAKLEKGEFKVYTKLEQLKKVEELEKLEKKIGGIKDMIELPGAIFVVDVKENELAVKEARKVGIPIVAVVDTNNSPSFVDYPIPANDDAISSIRLVLGYVCKALIES